MKPLLDVRSLSVTFHTRGGDVHAVEDVSYTLDPGESLAIVGESGSGKSVSALSLIGLVPPPGKVENGQLFFKERDLLELSDKGFQQLRGREIAMVFQDPMTSLNPVLTIGQQLSEALVWLNRIINTEHSVVREDIHGFSRMLSLKKFQKIASPLLMINDSTKNMDNWTKNYVKIFNLEIEEEFDLETEEEFDPDLLYILEHMDISELNYEMIN